MSLGQLLRLRHRRVTPIAAPTTTGPIPIDQPQGTDPPVIRQTSLWRTGLLLATSAALGGIAVAIWNRRTLAQFRQQTPPGEE